MNLGKVTHYAQSFAAIQDEDKRDVTEKIDQLLKMIEDKPKTFKWKMRAKVGDSRVWYRTVEERA